jgi:DNA segregation ATPase FtsK/SpoIIIE, S-DNA-T family
MARKRGRRSKPFKVNLKKETMNSILAIIIISLGALVSVSFSRQGPILTRLYQLGSLLLGWTYIFLPFIFVSGGLLLTRIKWSIAKANVFLGSLITLISLAGLTQAGNVGEQLFLTISALITVPGTVIFYLAGTTIGTIIFFETSLEDIALFFQTFFKKISSLTTKVVHPSPNTSLSNKSMKVKGLSEEPNQTPQNQKPSFLPLNLKATQKDPLLSRDGKSEVVANQPGISNVAWELPPLSLLSDEKRGKAERGDVNKSAAIIEQTLKSFGIEAKVVEVNCGPAVTQYALEIALGTKLSKINALQSDLALALSAPQGQIRIEAPIPGRNLVGIEVPNHSLEFVSLKQILNSEIMRKNESKTAVALGLDVSGEAAISDITKMPHVLIAGSTGSGKSVCLNAFIASILFRSSPEEVKFIMVDPKRVELTGYNGIPHLLTPVIVDPEKVISALKWAINEMEKRYKLFAEVGVRNIAGYNNLSGFQAMPYIIIVVDELADIMLFAPSEVEDAITRLAQMARATGIHLLVATQRPSVDVLTGLIKANIPCRIAFNVTSMIDSRVIIDTPGAEKLLGRGDMLYIPPDQAKPRRIQGAFVDDAEINALIKYLQNTGKEPEYQDDVTSAYRAKGKSSFSGNENLDNVDEQFEDAIRICVDSGKASASLLQRRLSIGYARAARILDQLERAGIISASDGSSKPRDVLIKSSEEFLSRVAQ